MAKTNEEFLRDLNSKDMEKVILDMMYGSKLYKLIDKEFNKEACEKCPIVKGHFPDKPEKELEFHECDFNNSSCIHGNLIHWWLQQECKEEEMRKLINGLSD